MQPIIFSCNLAKLTYYDLVYLASFYRWSAFRGRPAFGSRSPLTGKQYDGASSTMHNKPFKAGYIAMAKVYLIQAAEVRKQILKLQTV